MQLFFRHSRLQVYETPEFLLPDIWPDDSAQGQNQRSADPKMRKQKLSEFVKQCFFAGTHAQAHIFQRESLQAADVFLRAVDRNKRRRSGRDGKSQ